MKLKKIFKKIPVIKFQGSRDVEITGVCSHSKLVSPGNLFIARKGDSFDGTKYIPEAIAAGCVACVTDMYDPTLSIPQVILENVDALEAKIAATYYQHPSDELYMVGMTGTNGKTTSSYLAKHLLDKFIGPSGLMGTIEYIIGRHRYRPTHTTPDVSSNQKLLREMRIQGCRSSVMEVSSHALDQRRVEEIDYDVAVFTNLTQDHLDYHKTMEEYALAKKKLFSSMKPVNKKKQFTRAAFVNGESSWSALLTKDCPVPVYTFGIGDKYDLSASDLKMTPQGTHFTISWKGENRICFTPLVGRFNVYNTLAACGVCLIQNVPLRDVVKEIESFANVPGRLESVPNDLGIEIFVDYAHTDDALKNVLESLREIGNGKIITVFGCGGERDQEKRPLMAKVVEDYSDFAVITLDNCRKEDPESIIRDIIHGFSKPDHYILEKERALAIEKAIKMAEEKDIVLIAGKGHETQQVFASYAIEFDDRKMAREACDKILIERAKQ